MWTRRPSIENNVAVKCSECGEVVDPKEDPYYATPCGSFCGDCMYNLHAIDCVTCRREFDIDYGIEIAKEI